VTLPCAFLFVQFTVTKFKSFEGFRSLRVLIALIHYACQCRFWHGHEGDIRQVSFKPAPH
jgi:hypothetical protein